MNKNKGFTLIELLAVIVILAIIISFSTVNIMKQSRILQKKNEVSVANSIFAGVRRYVADNPKVLQNNLADTDPADIINSVSNVLIKNGYVDFDTNKYSTFENAKIKAKFCTIKDNYGNLTSDPYRISYYLVDSGNQILYNDCGCINQEKIEISGSEIDSFLICHDEYSGYTKDGKYYKLGDVSGWEPDSSRKLFE